MSRSDLSLSLSLSSTKASSSSSSSSCKIDSKKHMNGIIDLHYWQGQFETYFADKTTVLARCFDCSLSSQIHHLTNEIRFYIDDLEPKDLKDLKDLQNEISARFPSCHLLKYDENNARNTVCPSSRPEYYICVTEKAQKIVNGRIQFHDTFWAVVETRTSWICMGLFFLLILLIYLLRNHIKDYETSYFL